jgi:3-hydroxyacyl-[acyl-carrier-protein] dehydratase
MSETDGQPYADGERLPDAHIEEIMLALPHRYPFLLVDRIVDIVASESATGIKCVTASEPHFQGHFPTKPIMPGVLIIEAMAQTAAVLVIKSQKIDPVGKLVYFMSINEARFRRPVVPGDTLRIEVTKQRHRDKVWKFEGKAKVDGKVVAEAIFTAMVLEN